MTSFIVTGCGRSGTAWAAKFFTELGFPCTHEVCFSPYRHGPLVGAESSWLALPFIHTVNVPIIRVMRDPYMTVKSHLERSFLADKPHPGEDFTEFIYRFRPDIRDVPDHMGRVIRYVATWDRDVNAKPHIVLPVGDWTLDHLKNAVRYATGENVNSRRVEDALKRTGIVNRNPSGWRKSGLTYARITEHPLSHLLDARMKRWKLACRP